MNRAVFSRLTYWRTVNGCVHPRFGAINQILMQLGIIDEGIPFLVRFLQRQIVSDLGAGAVKQSQFASESPTKYRINGHPHLTNTGE